MKFKAASRASCAISALICACYTGVDIQDAVTTSDTGDESDAGEDDALIGEEQAFPGINGTPASAYITTHEGTFEITYLHMDNGYGVLDGDIILYGPDQDGLPDVGGGGRTYAVEQTSRLTAGQLRQTLATTSTDPVITLGPQSGAVISVTGTRWLNREILWEYDPNPMIPFGPNVQTRVEQAVAAIESAVNVDFITYNPLVHGANADRIRVVPVESGCSSHVGRLGGAQALSLGPRCSTGNVIHEFSHAIGLFHEQSRGDRDQHIVVNMNNVWGNMESNFGLRPSDTIGPYNLSSIMQYSPCAFSRCGDPNNTTQSCVVGMFECSYANRNSTPTANNPQAPDCTACVCEDPNGGCAFPTITGLQGQQFQIQRNALAQTDIDALEYALGCPDGFDGDHCGGPIGLDANTLYSCVDGHYTAKGNCGAGSCLPTGPGIDDVCSVDAVCPSGDGWYCGQAVGQDLTDHLYWCEAGLFHSSVPNPIDCGNGGCVVAPAGQSHHCLNSPTPPPPPNAECVGGPCCDNGNFSPAGSICEDDADSQYGCPWGVDAGDDVGVQYRDRTCSGTSSACEGDYGAWEPWQTADACTDMEFCNPGEATCTNVPPTPDCAGGVCCDPNGFFRPAGYVCATDAESEFGCPWGTNPGEDVGVRYRDQTCSGTSSACNGSFDAWKPWQTQDVCVGGEVCLPGDPTCNACAQSYWTPSNTSNVSWDSLVVAELELRKQEVSGDLVRTQVCKVAGNFNNDIHLDYVEWGKHNGLWMYSGTVSSAGVGCSQWVNLDTSTWTEGEIIGAQVRVVSPASCEGMWDFQCTGNPGCGNCWYWLSDTVMERTCL